MKLAIADANPIFAAASIDICQMGLEGEKWGVINASYERADGSGNYNFLQHGLQPNVGAITPQKGSGMLYLSTGHARTVGQSDNCGDVSCSEVGEGVPPAGFPQDVPGCAGGTTIFDDIAFEIKLRAPSNVTGFQFSFFFASFEYPKWVCSAFNDQFIVQMNPTPPGAINGNVVFNSSITPISVNAGSFDYCDSTSITDYAVGCTLGCPSPPNPYCPEGPFMLNGSGYNEWLDGSYSGATGWFRTHVPVEPGTEFILRFVIWDTGDRNLDSAVVIDNFTWLSGDVILGSEPF